MTKTLCVKKQTENRKLGRSRTFMGATYRPVGTTCPPRCPYLQAGNKGCYAMMGRVKLISREAEARNDSVRDYVAKARPGAVIRHLVSGDLFLNGRPDNDYINAMLDGHRDRPDVTGWAYTHGWTDLDPGRLNALPNLTVNASCDTVDEAREAFKAGWPVALTVGPDHPKGLTDFGDFLGLLCPAQATHERVTCASCKLCGKADRKLMGKPYAILFRWHSNKLERHTDPLEAFRAVGVPVKK